MQKNSNCHEMNNSYLINKCTSEGCPLNKSWEHRAHSTFPDAGQTLQHMSGLTDCRRCGEVFISVLIHLWSNVTGETTKWSIFFVRLYQWYDHMMIILILVFCQRTYGLIQSVGFVQLKYRNMFSKLLLMIQNYKSSNLTCFRPVNSQCEWNINQ